MPLYTIDIQIDEQFKAQIAPELLHRAVLATLLLHQEQQGPCELALVIADDEALQELNRRHLGVDAATDVLAFPDDTHGPFVGVPGFPRYLGDLIISFPRANAQATEVGHSVEAELQLLAVHGTLHLLGYDDVAQKDRTEMWEVQGEIVRTLSIAARLPE